MSNFDSDEFPNSESDNEFENNELEIKPSIKLRKTNNSTDTSYAKLDVISDEISDVVPDKISNDKMIEELCKCPVCFDYFDDNSKTCINGHSVCSICYKGNNTVLFSCPVCKSKFSDVKPLLYKQIIESMGFTQKCSYIGCDIEVKISELEPHKLVCKYRPVKCTIDGCNFEIFNDLKGLMHHYINVHQYNESVSIVDNKNIYNIKIRKNFDKSFRRVLSPAKNIIHLKDDNLLVIYDLKHKLSIDVNYNVYTLTYNTLRSNYNDKKTNNLYSLSGYYYAMSCNYNDKGCLQFNESQTFGISFMETESRWYVHFKIEKDDMILDPD